MSDDLCSISCKTYVINKDDIYYTFTIRWGREQSWMVTKTYNDFEALHAKITRLYGSAPYFTGKVAFWNRLQKATAEKRSGKLETYCQELWVQWRSWRPRRIVEVPHPDKDGEMTAVQEQLFEFFEMEENLEEKSASSSSVEATESASSSPSETPRGRPGSPPSTTASTDSYSGETSSEEAEQSSEDEHHIPAWKRKQEQDVHDDEWCDAGTELRFHHADNLKLQSRLVTHQVKIIVKDYTVYPRDRIDYNFLINFCGHSWIITKRYSELESFHKHLRDHYDSKAKSTKEEMPSLDAARVAVWNKTDASTGELRKRIFTNYFCLLVKKLDIWSHHDICQFHLPKMHNHEEVKLAVNRFIFDFFDFQAQQDKLSAEVAVSHVEAKEAALPQQQREKLQQSKEDEAAKQRHDNFVKRNRYMERLRTFEVEELCRLIQDFDDDRDALSLIDYFIEAGYFLAERMPQPVKGKNDRSNASVAETCIRSSCSMPPSTIAPSNASLASFAQNFSGRSQLLAAMDDDMSDRWRPPTEAGRAHWANESSRTISSGLDLPNTSSRSAMNDSGSPKGGNVSRRYDPQNPPPLAVGLTKPCGITSRQLSQIANAFYFNDTRIDAMERLSFVLLDDDHIDQALATLIYDWDKTKLSLLKLLSKRDPPERWQRVR